MAIRDASCLQYSLTDSERQQFNEQGYFMIENALSAAQVAALTATTDRIYEQKVAEGHDPKTELFYLNSIPDDTI